MNNNFQDNILHLGIKLIEEVAVQIIKTPKNLILFFFSKV